MDDLARLMKEARDEIRADWDEGRNYRALVGARRKQRRRRVMQTASAVAAVAVLAVGGALWEGGDTRTGDVAHRSGDESVGSERGDIASGSVSPADTAVIRLLDGSTATPLDTETELRLAANSTHNVEIQLERGGGRFEVTPNPERRFVVRAGVVEVSVLGTVFEVSRSADKAEVIVLRGRVRVSTPAGEEELGAGEKGNFGASGRLVAGSRGESETADVTPALERKQKVRPQWRSMVHSGDYTGAYAVLKDTDSKVVRDVAVELMEAADAARLSGHPLEATRYLRRLLDKHPGDPLAPLAAFTLGRLLLDRLSDPGKAAKMFARVRELAPAGALAQDALAREVEAWAKAGDTKRARTRAMKYMERFPNGRRLEAVRTHGGLK